MPLLSVDTWHQAYFKGSAVDVAAHRPIVLRDPQFVRKLFFASDRID